jgi:Pentapeptide repeats (8 copies)
VDQDQQSRWRPTRGQVLWTVGIVVALVVAIIIVLGYVLGWEWTGLVKDKAYTKRTLWDWLQLLIIPAVLAGVGLWFNRQQREQELQTADRRAQDEALQAYLDQIGQLLLDKNPSLRQAKEDAEVRTLARARTLTVLARLDGERKGSIVRFLSEATLIQKEKGANEEHVTSEPVISLSGADLGRVYLIGANLSEANLSEANLSTASLSRANLSPATLSRATLSRADLSRANLSEADLSEAKGITNEQLEQARSLDGATMPNGQKYEDWLKSKGRGEDRENSGAT